MNDRGGQSHVRYMRGMVDASPSPSKAVAQSFTIFVEIYIFTPNTLKFSQIGKIGTSLLE